MAATGGDEAEWLELVLLDGDPAARAAFTASLLPAIAEHVEELALDQPGDLGDLGVIEGAVLPALLGKWRRDPATDPEVERRPGVLAEAAAWAALPAEEQARRRTAAAAEAVAEQRRMAEWDAEHRGRA